MNPSLGIEPDLLSSFLMTIIIMPGSSDTYNQYYSIFYKSYESIIIIKKSMENVFN